MLENTVIFPLIFKLSYTNIGSIHMHFVLLFRFIIFTWYFVYPLNVTFVKIIVVQYLRIIGHVLVVIKFKLLSKFQALKAHFNAALLWY